MPEPLNFERIPARGSMKWTTYPATVLPAWVADMDFEIAPAIRATLSDMIARSDAGYPLPYAKAGLADIFCARMQQRWAWQIAPSQVEFFSDVATCDDAFDRSMAMFRVDVKLKSSVSIPPPDSSMVSAAWLESVSKMYVSLPAPPVNTFASELPISVSFNVLPMTFSTVVLDDNVRTTPVFTTCEVDLDRSTKILRVVVLLKSSVSTPPPASLIVSFPSARSVSNL